MGISALGLNYIKKYFPCESLLSLSYPDMVMSQEELKQTLGFNTTCETNYGSWHGRNHPLPDTEEVFLKMGVKSTRYVDIVASRGKEEIFDLNYPQCLGAYDIVLDCGTTEHCANIWQATLNAANAVKVGGVIFHTPPLTMLNHGFYCPQPTFYHDLYTQNNWQIEILVAISREGQPTPLQPTLRFNAGSNVSSYIIAKRLDGSCLKFPMQSKYLNNPGLK